MEIVKENIQTDLHGGLISFSEAARFTAPKNIETRQWCKVHNRPAPRYALYPRTRCFMKMVKEVAADSSVTAIYELTIAHAPPSAVYGSAPTSWKVSRNPTWSKIGGSMSMLIASR